MKKVVLFFAVATAVALASCGGSTEQAQPNVAADSAGVVDEVVVVELDSVAAPADSAAVADTAAVAK